ncbi:ATP-dependent DNA helicase UvrD/PcrA/Rep, epsilon proteobacterial type 2 [Helicobacter heilmannii]|uniref:ATP-dependent helicase n=1 Tax=Helicobacter heilmannii TaxID=35817 RepID=UPI0006A026F3|nr:ATP-dependent helicase [Helicobacter heilmannii]CRF46793.1 ATP-dependent DNA helicase UvrD/PcrA/Rep, epsilon proteobacterial type 2 [Helicobacter heilmannii]
MNLQALLDGLNPAQQEAVCHTKGPLLILAGAGSGKTKTLTTRLAYLIGSIGVHPKNTLTLTFTNKAAKEMRERTLALLGEWRGHYRPMLCTFHSFGNFFLRKTLKNEKYAEFLRRNKDFIIKTPQELKRELKSLLLPYKQHYEKSWEDDKHFLNFLFKGFSLIKNGHIIWRGNSDFVFNEAYGLYLDHLERGNCVDYDDLIAFPYTLLAEYPELAKQVSQFYQYISVDEYQDTNPLQFKLLQQLCCTHDNLCVVGDDDQSIYGFNGAEIRNILEFDRHFKGVKIIKLEQNYRSIPNIVGSANQLIAHNQCRHEKTLFSQKNQGSDENIKYEHFKETKEEHTFICDKINACRAKNIPYEEIAILYRLKHLASGLEKTLREANIPYTIVGSTGFFERAEIKDRLAYLRALVNRDDDGALVRLLKKSEGFGKKSLEKIQNTATNKHHSIAKAYQEGLFQDFPKVHTHLQGFFTILDDLSAKAMHLSTPKQALELLAGYAQIDKESSANDTDDEVLERILAFATMLQDFICESLEFRGSVSLQDFLDQIALETDDPTTDSTTTKGVQCMTVHASKGLEFRVVFIIGLEEGTFPIEKKDFFTGEYTNIEEERRLAYVAITRAKEEAYLCSVQKKFFWKDSTPSRFIKEAGLVQTLCVGDRVHHAQHGSGFIKSISGGYFQVSFNHGLVWLPPTSVKKLEL